jgi:5-methylcytosine-specific restriction endonuclease McrA
MSKKRKWNQEELRRAVSSSTSVRQVLGKIGLIQAGGNYNQINKYIKKLNINTKHFKGKGWNIGMTGIGKPRITIEKILVMDSDFQSFKLKNRLFEIGLKNKECEECGWKKISKDGRLPLELDHINGDGRDNRIDNLRVLCPNCHSLKSTHRGRNRKSSGGGIGIRATLKMSSAKADAGSTPAPSTGQ